MQSPQTSERHEELIDHLNELIALEYDAIAAYEAAVDRLESKQLTQQMQGFLADHQRHQQELAQCVESLGGTARERGDIKKVLTKGKVVLASLVSDELILEAMKTNEDETNEKYETAVSECSSMAPPRIAQVLARALEDERRHRSWIVATLQKQ